MYGPPGTGKTLLARAVATESQANFVTISGPEVFSKWVGDSEKAVRQLFKKARQAAPSIIFIDEIDALAPARGTSSADSGVSERVVNQLLTSMDGLRNLDGVVVIAATNRPDTLDTALLRPGRFDRLILVPLPNREIRLEILKIHTRGMPLAGVDLEEISRRTEGFVGADIESLCMEAGLCALRRAQGTVPAGQARNAEGGPGKNGNTTLPRQKKLADTPGMTVTQGDFEQALKGVHPTVSPETAASYENYRKELESGISKWKKDDTGNYLR
jgi:transitional endoplasmic reticulum ATPase